MLFFLKLNLLHDVLNRSFQDMDPHKTEYLFLDEFEEILWEICPELNDEEMNYIYQKHGSKYNKRFLKNENLKDNLSCNI